MRLFQVQMVYFGEINHCILTSWKSMVVHEQPLVATVRGRFRLGSNETAYGCSVRFCGSVNQRAPNMAKTKTK